MMRASDIPMGECYLIAKVLPSPVSAKLAEMGCLPGSTIELVMKAPLNDPLAFEINGDFLLSMRQTEAALIEVTAKASDG
jgi:ferrous iron transport protein A